MIKTIITAVMLIFSASTALIGADSYAQDRYFFGTGEWEPLTGSKLEGNGLAAEIVRKAFKTAGIELEIKFYPWKRCEMMLQQQKIDAIFPYTQTVERKEIYSFSDPVFVVRTKFFYLKKNIKDLKFNTYEDLKKYRIGGVLGYFYQKEFEKAGLNVEYVASDELNIKKMLADRIDLFPTADINGWYLLKNHFPDEYENFSAVDYDLSGDRKSDEEIASRIMVLKENRKGHEIITVYNRELQKMKQNGDYEKIFLKYGVKTD